MSEPTDVVRNVLQRLWDEHKDVSAESIVAVATPEDHPLHCRFEWNQDEAAHLYRLEQARLLVRTVRVDRGGGESIREWIHIQRTEIVEAGGALVAVPADSYVPIQYVQDSPSLLSAVREQMHRDWSALKRKYQQYEEFWTLVGEKVSTAA